MALQIVVGGRNDDRCRDRMDGNAEIVHGKLSLDIHCGQSSIYSPHWVFVVWRDHRISSVVRAGNENNAVIGMDSSVCNRHGWSGLDCGSLPDGADTCTFGRARIRNPHRSSTELDRLADTNCFSL